MKKTIREWLETLPEPYRSQALENTEEYKLSEDKDDCLSEAIESAFTWKLTKQGLQYWINVFDSVENAEKSGGMINIEDALNRIDVTVKTVNEEAVKKSNREIAEEIAASTDKGYLCSGDIDAIELILNKYL